MLVLKRLLVGLGLATALVAAHAAPTLALDLTTGGVATPCGGCASPAGTMFGWSFRLTAPITINQLGFWDAGSDGLGVPGVPTGLWTESGTLLASATVTNASESVASASADGSWLFEDIAQLTLQPGAYRIAGLFQNDDPLAQIGAGFTTVAEVVLTGGIAGTLGAGFDFPGDPFGAPIIGPNMRLADAQVPEPASLVLVAMGLALAGAGRRRARAGAL